MLISLTIGAGQKNNHMVKTRFHSHNAYILKISNLLEIFISYNTPIGVNVGGKFMTSKRWYSSSTTRQTSRYVRENFLNVEYMEYTSFIQMIKTYAAANDFSLGLLR